VVVGAVDYGATNDFFLAAKVHSNVYGLMAFERKKRKWVYLFLRSFPGPGYETLSLLLLSFSFRCWPDEVAPGQDPSSSSRGVKRRYVLSLSCQHVVIFPTFLFFFFARPICVNE
jgi:hypothetical protein